MGYAVGLLLANVCAVLMNYGQPALLYLVPCTLGSLALVGYFDGDLQVLWDGPVPMRIEHQSYNSVNQLELSHS